MVAVFPHGIFLPVVISMTVIALLFDFIYNPEIGLLNQLLEAVGLDELTRAWLGDENTAMLSVILCLNGSLSVTLPCCTLSRFRAFPLNYMNRRSWTEPEKSSSFSHYGAADERNVVCCRGDDADRRIYRI